MTLQEYLKECDEFEKAVIILNIARKYPSYETMSQFQKKQILAEILEEEINKK